MKLTPPAECQEYTCTEPATMIVKVEAFVREGDQPIEVVIGLKVCAAHVPDAGIIDGAIWNILDSWALLSRKGLCDRSLTRVYGVPIGGEEARLLALSKAERDADAANRRLHEMDDQPELPHTELTELAMRGPLGELRPVPAIVRLEKKLAFMWGRHGAGPEGRKCKDCVRCRYVQYSKRYYKCDAYGDSRGPGTDWRVNWPACGLFQAEFGPQRRDRDGRT